MKNRQKDRKDWQGFSPLPVIGVDEAGRGCLAGPVFASAVILKDKTQYPDSKEVSPKLRETLALDIMKRHIWALGVANVKEIESLNILQAGLLAMKRAVLKLPVKAGHVLVDGCFKIPGLTYSQTTVIKGDQIYSPISASSIIAKVKRDKWIALQDKRYPRYGFARHKGYPTVQHKKAIALYGPCPLHRRTFKGVGLQSR